MRDKMLFIFNPFSGKGLIRSHLVDILDTMVKAGFELTTYVTQFQGDATEKIMAEGAHYDRIVCSGGDGTLDEVVTGMKRAELHVPLGYIPAGSTNDFANSLGLPNDMTEAARVAVGNRRFPCDVGDFNGDTFVYVAAFGLFTEVSYKTPQQMKNILGHAAYILEGVKRLSDIQSYNLQVEWDHKVIQDKFIYGMVTNSHSIGGFRGITGTGKEVLLDDGVFEVTLIRKPSNPLELNNIIVAMVDKRVKSEHIYSFTASRIVVESEEPLAWTLDGEFGGEPRKAVIENKTKALEIRVPK